MCSSGSGSGSSSSSDAMVVSLGHLARLQELHLTVHGSPAAGSSLPQQLQALSVCVAADRSRGRHEIEQEHEKEHEAGDVEHEQVAGEEYGQEEPGHGEHRQQQQQEEQEPYHVEQLHITALQQLQQLHLTGGCGEGPAVVPTAVETTSMGQEPVESTDLLQKHPGFLDNMSCSSQLAPSGAKGEQCSAQHPVLQGVLPYSLFGHAFCAI
jgi:hypothetical protein